tara:strand:+ start:3497 stop:4324 length:828 start_codon:yes stop_codon:yes gene_type:complete
MRLQNGDKWPVVYHGNGPAKNNDIWKRLVDRFEKLEPWQERKPKIEGITVLTWSIPSETTLLERSFEKMGIRDELIVIPLSKPINWLDKIKKTREYLQKIETKYVMGLDSTDIIVSTDQEGQKTLWYDIKETFKSMNCKLLYNAEKLNWPSSNGHGTDIKEEDGRNGELLKALIRTEKLEEDVYKDFAGSSFFRMNSGAFIGYTDFTKTFYDDLWRNYVSTHYDGGMNENFFGGDQGFIRIMQDKYFPDLRADCHCEIFQTFADINESDITGVYS